MGLCQNKPQTADSVLVIVEPNQGPEITVIPYKEDDGQDDWAWNLLLLFYINFLYTILYMPPLCIAWWAALFGYKDWIYEILVPVELPDKVKSLAFFYDVYEVRE